MLSALQGPSVVPFVEKLLCKALLNCLELGMNVPITHSQIGVFGGSATGCPVGVFGSFTLGSTSLLNKVGWAHDLPQVPPFPSYTLRRVLVCASLPSGLHPTHYT